MDCWDGCWFCVFDIEKVAAMKRLVLIAIIVLMNCSVVFADIHEDQLQVQRDILTVAQQIQVNTSDVGEYWKIVSLFLGGVSIMAFVMGVRSGGEM